MLHALKSKKSNPTLIISLQAQKLSPNIKKSKRIFLVWKLETHGRILGPKALYTKK